MVVYIQSTNSTKSWKKGESTTEKGIPQHTKKWTKVLLTLAISTTLSLLFVLLVDCSGISSPDIICKYSILTLCVT